MEKCQYHKNKDSVRNCSVCGTPLCENCIIINDGKACCYKCAKKIDDTTQKTTTNTRSETEEVYTQYESDTSDSTSGTNNTNNTNNTSYTTNNEKKYSKSPAEIDNVLFMLLSLIPGFGHIYLNLIGVGLVYFVSFAVMSILHFGFFAFIIWVVAIMDAYKTKDKILNGQIIEDNLDSLKELLNDRAFVTILTIVVIITVIGVFFRAIGIVFSHFWIFSILMIALIYYFYSSRK